MGLRQLEEEEEEGNDANGITQHSQISVSGNIDLHPQVQQGSLSAAVVRIDLHGPRPR